ncbi:MAG: HEAT repeat domain-containing protein [Pontiellaceae bacterium]|jgi:HEAT repeat protein|nr:HEAT repeat domain-containing protein [Pontiellaceae bacterium]
MMGKRFMTAGFFALLLYSGAFRVSASCLTDGFRTPPYQWQINQALERLKNPDASVRAGAAEQLGFMRAYGEAQAVAVLTADPDAAVRREAVMALGWIGSRDSIAPLTAVLTDSDWTVRQAAAVSLQNLTGIPFAFDALADETNQKRRIAEWQKTFTSADIEKEALAVLADPAADFFTKADRIRAAGTFDCKTVAPALVEALRPYLSKKYPGDNLERLYTPASPAVDARPERAFVQAGLRALGRIGGKEAEAFLIQMLETNVNWACYAAEALGDCGSGTAVQALLRNYPLFAFNLDHPRAFETYKKVVEKFPAHDAPHLLAVDRIPRTAYEILFALSRLDLSRHTKELEAITPYILSTVPNSLDATIVYSKEPWAMIFGYLLETAGVRRQAADAAFAALGISGRSLPDHFLFKDEFMHEALKNLDSGNSRHAPYAGLILLCTAQKSDIPDLIRLLDHPDGWIKIDAAKTLMLLDTQEAVAPLITRLNETQDDAGYGYGMDFKRFKFNRIDEKKLPGEGYDEYSDPSPRFKEAWLRALGHLKAPEALPVLINYLNNDRNALEIQASAALALDDLGTPAALDALQLAEAGHPVHVVQLIAREALRRNQIAQQQMPPDEKTEFIEQCPVPDGLPAELVFIKGDRVPGNNEEVSKDITAYSTTDGGPTYRLGRNIFRIRTGDPEKSLQQLTHFTSGYVADLEVSYDGKKLLFAHSTMAPDPWFHIYEMNADGTGLKQLTFGPYHDVHPNFMPDGRIVFTSTRSGIRDEYHGYPANGLSVMNADGSDIHLIGFNIGRDAEPVVGDDGKILFTRLELFYSRMKTEWNLLSVYPDGTKTATLYGPERREIHFTIGGTDSIVTPRHRVLRLTQPQSWIGGTYLLNTFKGPMIAGPGRNHEIFLNPDNRWAITTPYKIDETTLLVAAGKRPVVIEPTEQQIKDKLKPGDLDIYGSVDHGLYWMEVSTGKLTLIYNDPERADFEARPLQPRHVPPVLPASPLTRSRAFSGTVYCSSAFITQDPFVKERGKYIRAVEGIPTVTRHQTHASGGVAWRNHGGAVGRVFGTVPLAADGSFSLELPSDRFFHMQVLDADRRVMGNELIWQYVRPQEIKGCVGCHENPDEAPSPVAFPLAQKQPSVQCFPQGDEMQYRAKMWFKGWAPDEREERMRTVNSVNIIGRN